MKQSSESGAEDKQPDGDLSQAQFDLAGYKPEDIVTAIVVQPTPLDTIPEKGSSPESMVDGSEPMTMQEQVN